MQWCDLDLTFDLAVVTLTFKMGWGTGISDAIFVITIHTENIIIHTKKK